MWSATWGICKFVKMFLKNQIDIKSQPAKKFSLYVTCFNMCHGGGGVKSWIHKAWLLLGFPFFKDIFVPWRGMMWCGLPHPSLWREEKSMAISSSLVNVITASRIWSIFSSQNSRLKLLHSLNTGLLCVSTLSFKENSWSTKSWLRNFAQLKPGLHCRCQPNRINLPYTGKAV